jgi:hypothetical protein
MLLKDIYESSNYITDEEMTTEQAVNSANSAIAEINTKVGTNLPFFTDENYQESEYDAFSNSWQLRLIEPYLSFTIATNDSDSDARDFHYNRFIMALSEFRTNGLSSIKTTYIDEDGNEVDTGYAGNAKRVVKVDASTRVNPFSGWWL